MASKVTMYVRGTFGVIKTEATDLKVEVGPCAQYSSAVKVEFKPKGKRKMRGFVQTYKPSLLVLEGWGHPDPDSAFGEETDAGNGMIVNRTRYASCDERYQTEFDAKINTYLATSDAKVVCDYRGHNSYGG